MIKTLKGERDGIGFSFSVCCIQGYNRPLAPVAAYDHGEHVKIYKRYDLKQKMVLSLFTAHRLDRINASVKFNDRILYGS